MMMEQQNNHQDRLSSLPDPLLVSILSLLTIKQAASTSVLSHRYTHLWTQITRLNIPYICLPIQSYVPTLTHIFDQLTSNKLQSFHLKFPHLSDSVLETLFRYACDHNVEEINFSSVFLPFDRRLPACTYICTSLIVLEIEEGFSSVLPDDDDGTVVINLPNLRKLVLSFLVCWQPEKLSKLFRSCPVLEVLDLNIQSCDLGVCKDISCQNLRFLSINVGCIDKGCNYIINAPKLEVFDVNGGVSSFRFVENPCSLFKATIKAPKLDDMGVGYHVGLLPEATIKAPKFEDVGVEYLEKMSALVKGICSVQSLEVTSIPLRSLVHADGNIVSTFHNLLQLHICLDDASASKNLLHCLHCAPNLEVLCIEKCVREEGFKWDVPDCVPLCISRKIKRMIVKGLEGSEQELAFLKYILSNANVLNSFFVGVLSKSAAKIPMEECFCKNLFAFPRSSRTCRIDFQGGYLHSSSTENHSCAEGKLQCEIQL